MDPFNLQQQLKNNNKELLDFCEDLKKWGDDTKKKEQTKQQQSTKRITQSPVKKEKPKKSNEEPEKLKKKVMTYNDWEKFDADKECEKVDEESDSDLTDENDELQKEAALLEKDKGNRCVKNGKWKEAIVYYTTAIDYYGYDPVFYANRGLCYLKINEMEKAEKDCTVSLSLDSTYVKAYQRRAVAREALNKLVDAKNDLLRVLQFEPNNRESKSNLENLKKKIAAAKTDQGETSKPVSKFTATKPKAVGQIETEKPKIVWPSGEQKNIVRAIKKPPHLRSKKPLVRIKIEEVNSLKPPVAKEIQKPKETLSLNLDDLKVVERKQLDSSVTISPAIEIKVLEVPKTSVQFYSKWKELKGCYDKKYEYLKIIKPQNLPEIFKYSLESEVFSDILQILVNYFVDINVIVEYLENLSKIERFSALTMFLSSNDKEALTKIFDMMMESGRNPQEIQELKIKYEL